MSEPFRVGYTNDFLKSDGSIGWGDIGMAKYEGIPDLEVEFMPEHPMVLPVEFAQGYDALGVLAPKITAELLDNSPRPDAGGAVRRGVRLGRYRGGDAQWHRGVDHAGSACGGRWRRPR